MPVSQGSAGGLPGMTLKAWGLVNTASNTLVKGFNVDGVVGNQINLTTALGSTNVAVRMHFMGNLDVVLSGYASTTTAVILGAYRISSGGTPQSGLMFFEVWE